MTSTPLPSSLIAAAAHEHAAARAGAPGASAWRTLTLRNYSRTLVWTLAAVGVCGIGYLIEKFLLIGLLHWLPDSTHYRMFKNPAELPMRLFGLPHFIVGLAFMLSSKRMRGARSYAWLAGLTAIGVAMCAGFYRFGAHTNPLALLLFYFYFLIHGFRDEAFFYKSYGDMPREAAATHDRIMTVLQWTLLGLMMSMLVPAYQIYGELKPRYNHPALEAIFPAEWPYWERFLSMMGPMALIAVAALWRISRVFPDGLAGLWRTHRPILIVFLMSTAIILVPMATGPWSFNIVVLMHFVGWYLFGRHCLRTRPPKEPAATWWSWMRTDPRGFSVLHLGLAAAVVVLVAVATYHFGKQGALEAVVGSKTFYYWTIMHVTLSFFPRT